MSGQFGIKNTAEVIVLAGEVTALFLVARKRGFAGTLIEYVTSEDFRKEAVDAFSDISEVPNEIRDIQGSEVFDLFKISVDTWEKVVKKVNAA